MTGQAQLELDPAAPTDVEVHRLVIPAVAIVKKRGAEPSAPAPHAMPRPRAKVVNLGPQTRADVYVPTWATKEMSRIRALGAQSLPRLREEIPLGIRLTLAFPRPQSHYSASGAVFPRYLERRPLSKNNGDVDNLAKLVLDGLGDSRDEPGIFKSDAQITRLIAERFYFDQAGLLEPCTIVEVFELNPPT